MSSELDALAESHGIQIRYTSETGDKREIGDGAKRALLEALGVDPDGGERGEFAERDVEPDGACVDPADLLPGSVFGVAVQLYGLRSERNLGIGDFADLARAAEIAGEAGAAFLGVNPLHALFGADPGRFSPYSPSTRRFLNPIYIAVDALPAGKAATERLRGEAPDLFGGLDGDLVDYPAAGRLKTQLLRAIFDAERKAIEGDADFAGFREEEGASLRDFALFEAISAEMVARGSGAGWHGWPDEWRSRQGEAVGRFEHEGADAILFHEWLQFVADRQLGQAQERARSAGMRLGLYLDFAVGVAPDGAETWIDPGLTVGAARVGSPPDMFNSTGQDWGLAPLSPEALDKADYAPLRGAYHRLMRHAGAIRIDHAMGLARLWWIPQDGGSGEGGYVRYPLGAMLGAVAESSRGNRCIVIGEDLGTVPDGFRPAMERGRVLSYRVLYFEREKDGGFILPAKYPELALACVSTHDLATLAGWWKGSDIRLRAETGRQDEANTKRDLADRDRDRRELVEALAAEGLLSDGLEALAEKGASLPDEIPAPLAVAVHRYGARSRSLLFAVQLEDMLLSDRQANLPGTTDEYPNWRVRLQHDLEDVARDPRFADMARALREERPETA